MLKVIFIDESLLAINPRYRGDMYHTKFFRDNDFEEVCDYLITNTNYKLDDYENAYSMACIGCGKELGIYDEYVNVVGDEYCCKNCDEKGSW